MKVFITSQKGSHRPTNEDCHSVMVNINGSNKQKAPVNFFAVYDGHGGDYISKYLNNSLTPILTHKDMKYPITQAMGNRIQTAIQNELKTNPQLTQKATMAGSTSLAVINYKSNGTSYLNILNTGDSRCVLCRDNMAICLTKDHKPSWPEEHARIKKMGGTVVRDRYGEWRIGDLAVSRAFGDLDSQPYVSHLPEVFHYRLSRKDKFMILACDGLWDVVSNQEAVNFILDTCYDMETGRYNNKHKNIAQKLAEFGYSKGSTDNITIIVVFFE